MTFSFIKAVVPEDIYLYKPIHDNQNDIIGSCVLYNERADVTSSVKNMSLYEALTL